MEHELLRRASSGLRLALVRGTVKWASKYKARVYGPNMPKCYCRSAIKRRNNVHTATLPRQGEFVRQQQVDLINQSPASVVGPLHAGERTLKQQ